MVKMACGHAFDNLSLLELRKSIVSMHSMCGIMIAGVACTLLYVNYDLIRRICTNSNSYS